VGESSAQRLGRPPSSPLDIDEEEIKKTSIGSSTRSLLTTLHWLGKEKSQKFKQLG